MGGVREGLTEQTEEVVARPGCPICGGSVVPTGMRYRCGRCGFSLCVGCEPVEFGEEREIVACRSSSE
jgi:ribosomal protein S27AE